MATKTVESRLRRILSEQGFDGEDVTLNSTMVNDLGMDSLDSVELVMGIEEEFDIEIPDDDLEKITTFGQLLAYTNKALGNLSEEAVETST
jgi:acyl carrier protein